MGRYLLGRLVAAIFTLLIISIVSFLIIQLPPGDFISGFIARLQQTGEQIDQGLIDALRHRYGLDRPLHVQYLKWMGGLLQGDLGFSFGWNKPVSELIGGRLAMTMVVTMASLAFTWAIALPIGMLSAVRQYSIIDYVATVIGFLGLAVPNFMLALILMWFSYSVLGTTVGGLFSIEYINAAWTWAKIVDLLKHLWIPAIVVGTAGTASVIRVLRANLLDELSRPYVETARAKGVPEVRLIIKYPLRLAINPFISTVGWLLPELISGAAITAVVLSLPTSGPLLLNSLKEQDMYLAGSFVMLLSALTVIGTMISDLLLAVVDPRIRYGAVGKA